VGSSSLQEHITLLLLLLLLLLQWLLSNVGQFGSTLIIYASHHFSSFAAL
jgi:hypothetical protein